MFPFRLLIFSYILLKSHRGYKSPGRAGQGRVSTISVVTWQPGISSPLGAMNNVVQLQELLHPHFRAIIIWETERC